MRPNQYAYLHGKCPRTLCKACQQESCKLDDFQMGPLLDTQSNHFAYGVQVHVIFRFIPPYQPLFFPFRAIILPIAHETRDYRNKCFTGFFDLPPILNVRLDLPPIFKIIRLCPLHEGNLKELRKSRGLSRKITLKKSDIAPHFYMIL